MSSGNNTTPIPLTLNPKRIHMPSSRTRNSRRKVRSARKYYSPSPIKSAPNVKVHRGSKKRKKTGARKNLNDLFNTMTA